MSAIEPPHPFGPTDQLRAHACIPSDDDRQRHRWRTQRLFDLAVTASMAEPRRTARAIGIDERSLREMRDVPSLGYIARIGRLLGIETATAASVVGLHAMGSGRAAIDTPALLESISRADIEDDAAELDRLSALLSAAAREPGDLALSILCGARADAARGETAAAADRVRYAGNLGIPERYASLATQLLGCVEIEASLGEAWTAFTQSAPCADANHRAHPRTARAHDALSARAIVASLALQLLHAMGARTSRACELIAALRRHVADTVELGCPHAIAWSASIAGIAALRLREFDGISREADRAAMSLFVASQFAIDEHIASCAPSPPMSLLRRRLRLALHEWCDRARRGEVSQALLDEVDDSEVRTMIVRYPRARPFGLARRSNGEIADHIFESGRSFVEMIHVPSALRRAQSQ